MAAQPFGASSRPASPTLVDPNAQLPGSVQVTLASFRLEEPTIESVIEDVKILRSTIASLVGRISDLEGRLAQNESSVSYLVDRQGIEVVLDRYTALHDDAVFDLDKRREWENLFTEDGVAIYPFGTHKGRAGKGDWAFGSVSYFERCQLLSSNFNISFAVPDTDGTVRKAHVRSNCIAQWLRKKDVLGDHFDEGGFYYWTLRREEQENGVWRWAIEHVHLTITWTTGDDPSGVGPKEGRQGKDRVGTEEVGSAVDDEELGDGAGQG